MGYKNKPFSSLFQNNKYFCNYCDYGTCKKSNYDSHILTPKHSKNANGYTMGQKQAEKQPKSDTLQNNMFVCSCGNEYKHRQGLWRHKLNCLDNNSNETEKMTNVEKETSDKETSDKDLIMLLIKENSEFIQYFWAIQRDDSCYIYDTNSQVCP
jgi:hypothetical protein